MLSFIFRKICIQENMSSPFLLLFVVVVVVVITTSIDPFVLLENYLCIAIFGQNTFIDFE